MTRSIVRVAGFLTGLGFLFSLPLAFAYAATASVSNISPGTTVSVGQPVTLTISSNGFNNPYYTLSDNFGGTSVTGSDINSGGTFNWTPTQNDIGTHELTILVDDSNGDSATVTQDITVGGQTTASIQSLSPGNTVNSGQQVSFTISSTGIANPTYTVSDSFSGSSVTGSDLNGSAFFWTPQVGDAGSHTITVTVSGVGGSASATTQITVNAVPTISVANVANASFPYGTPISLTVSAQGFSSPAYTLADSFGGTTLNSGDIATDGMLVWTPQAQDVGAHTVTFYANDNSDHSASAEYAFTITSAAATTSAVTTTTSGSSLTAAQSSAILSLLQSFGVDQTTINTVSQILTGTSVATGSTSSSQGTSAAGGYTFTEYLAPGSQDSEVLQLQDLLQQQGFLTATPNGYFGDATEAAVIAFQAAHGIEQLGVVGPATRAALNTITGGTGASTSSSTSTSGTVGDGYVFQNPINPGDDDQDVTELQTRLAALGYFSGTPTGYYGSETQAAVEAFQTAQGIDPVGYVGPQTMAALNSQ